MPQGKTQEPLTVAKLSAALNMPSAEVLKVAKQVGSSARNAADRLDDDEAEAIRQAAVGMRDDITAEAEVVDILDDSSLAKAREAFNPLLSEPELQAAIDRLAQNAQKMASAHADGMSAAAFDKELSTGDGLDARLIDAELKGTLAKHGLTPLDTIEGLTKLREFLVAAYRDTRLVEPETALKAMQISMDVQKIEATHASVILAHQHSVETKRIEEETKQKVAAAQANATVVNAQADAHVGTIAAKSKVKSADIDDKLMSDTKHTEEVDKLLANRRRRQKIVWQQSTKPKIKLALKIAIPLILASNLIADGPGRHSTPVFGQVNTVWDAVYMPLRDGTVRTFNDVTHQKHVTNTPPLIPTTAPVVPPPPSQPPP